MSSKCGPQANITTLSGSWFRTQHLQMSLGPAELKKKKKENVVEDSPINWLTILQVKKHTQESTISSRAIKY